MIRFNDILEQVTSYNPQADLDLLKKAYVFSAKVHQGQVRLSGEPYLIHPLEVAHLLVKLRLDTASVVTGLLHDALEDTYTTPEELRESFGEEIAQLVDGVTKISKITLQASEEDQAENFRKMILAMVKDIRIILVAGRARDVQLGLGREHEVLHHDGVEFLVAKKAFRVGLPERGLLLLGHGHFTD